MLQMMCAVDDLALLLGLAFIVECAGQPKHAGHVVNTVAPDETANDAVRVLDLLHVLEERLVGRKRVVVTEEPIEM